MYYHDNEWSNTIDWNYDICYYEYALSDHDHSIIARSSQMYYNDS